MKSYFPFNALLWLLLLASGVFGIGTAQAQHVESLDAIYRDLGPRSSWADVQAAVGNGRAATALRVTVSRIDNWTFRGPWTATSASDRLAIFSDDGCTITITTPDGTVQTPINRFGQGQDLFNIGQSLTALPFTPTANTTYNIEVRYRNAFHTGPNDIDGLTLFHYREITEPPAEYDAQLASNEITARSARLFWQPYPRAADFVSYTLFLDTQNPVRMDADHRITVINTIGSPHFSATQLTPDTTYYAKLRLRYRENGQERTKDFAPHEFRTLKDEWRITLSGTPRACAGHIQDETHIVSLTATAQRRNEAGEWENAPTTEFRLSLKNVGSQGEPAQLLRRTTPGGAEQPVPVAETMAVSSDANAAFSIRVLSSQQVTSNVQIKAEAKIVADGQTTWEGVEVGNGRLEFGAVESKRLFGIINDWNETYANDTGWEFEPAIADGPNQIITCRLYLHFRRDTQEAAVNRNYFRRNGQDVLTLDTLPANGPDGWLSAEEQAAGEALGTRAIPLRNGVNGQPLWLPVNGHTVNVRIEGFSIPGDDNTAPVAGYDARVATFCDAAGNPIRVNTAGTGTELIPANQPVTIPDYIPVPVVNGVATFHIRSGSLIQQATCIDLRAKDVTQIK